MPGYGVMSHHKRFSCDLESLMRPQASLTGGGEGGGLGTNVTAGIPLRRWVSRSVSRRSASVLRVWTRGVALAFRRYMRSS